MPKELGILLIRMSVTAALLAAIISVGILERDAMAQGDLLKSHHKGIDLIIVPPEPGAKFDINIVSARQGLNNLARALDVLLRESPFSADAIEILKSNGRVAIAYDPNFPGPEACEIELARFFPHCFGRYGNGDFLVVVGRHGIQWPMRELAAILAHELVGHGMQHLRGRPSTMREVDSECEARLYQEKALQDLRIDKRSGTMVGFRRGLENLHCADFKLYMAQHRPDLFELWQALNPDVLRFLPVFDDYLRGLRNQP